ncbi:MAG TPA: helix-turn-helix domain-containing protein [Enterococcus sp.]|nr:helix-turn-helix domain-containing protein [Enterococcus sp.]
MKFEELLEKKEAKKMCLLKNLLLSGGKDTITEMMKKLQLSKKSVENYLEELRDDLAIYEGQCQLIYDKTNVEFWKIPEFSLRELELTWYQEAPKYQILIHLLENKEMAFIRLTQELAISESSLSRKIKEINTLLKEFKLMIWQGKIEGEESQIRYFYFQLMWYLDQYPKHLTGKEKHLIEQFERGFGLVFTEEAHQRINLWVKITKYRISIPKLSFQEFHKKFVPYQKDRFYLQLKPIFQRFFSYYAVEIREEEIMLHFIFLISMSLLNEKDFYHYSLQRSRFTPSSIADTLILENILRLYPRPKIRPEWEANCYYHLSQVHLRLYFFQGDVEVYDRENIWQLEAKLSSRNIQSYTKKMLGLAQDTLAIPYDEENSLLAMTEVKYLSIVAILDVEMNREIRIGIDLKMDPLFKEAAINMYMLHLNMINGVVVEACIPEHHYDLIITNQQQEKVRYYRLSELGTNYDIQEIKKIIRQLE